MAIVERAVGFRGNTAARIAAIGGRLALARRNLPEHLKGCKVSMQGGRLFVKRGSTVVASATGVADLVERASRSPAGGESAAMTAARAKIAAVKAAAAAPLLKIERIKAAANQSRYR